MVSINADVDLADIDTDDLVKELCKRSIPIKDKFKLQQEIELRFEREINDDEIDEIEAKCLKKLGIDLQWLNAAKDSAYCVKKEYSRTLLVKALPKCFEDVIGEMR